jgi:hypothetical protein
VLSTSFFSFAVFPLGAFPGMTILARRKLKRAAVSRSLETLRTLFSAALHYEAQGEGEERQQQRTQIPDTDHSLTQALTNQHSLFPTLFALPLFLMQGLQQGESLGCGSPFPNKNVYYKKNSCDVDKLMPVEKRKGEMHAKN